jgi:hypothetical protein
MLIRLADWFTNRAKRLMPIDTPAGIRALRVAWVLRDTASWLRGGEWRGLASLNASLDRVSRQSRPGVNPVVEGV